MKIRYLASCARFVALGVAAATLLTTPSQAQMNWGALGSIIGTTANIVQQNMDEKQADSWNEKGREAYRRGDYEEAVADFQRSLGFRNDPNVQGNLFLAQRAMQKQDARDGGLR